MNKHDDRAGTSGRGRTGVLRTAAVIGGSAVVICFAGPADAATIHAARGDAVGAVTSLTVQSAVGGDLEVGWQPGSGSPATSGYLVTADTPAGAVAAEATSHSLNATLTGLTAGASYDVAVVPVAAGLGPERAASASTTFTVLNDAAPQAMSDLSTSQVPGTNEVRVTWASPLTGVAASEQYVNLFAVVPGGGLGLVASTSCAAGCSSLTFRQLPTGLSYEAASIASNAAGFGPVSWSAPADVTTPCAAGACVTIDATSPGAAMTHPGDGVLDSLFPVGADTADLASLPGSSWRGAPDISPSGALTYGSLDAATAARASTTVILSNLWTATDPVNGGPATPWSNWTAYREWVARTVRTILSAGRHPTYWEIQNEPGGPGYYSAADQATVTPALLLQQFLVGYESIRSVDPSAQIIGPALEHFSSYPGQYGPQELDMTTFLDFAAAHGLTLAALSWHEIDDTLGPNPDTNSVLPAAIVDHVAEARALVAARPAVGQPKIFIDEYGMPEAAGDPGWTVAYLAALTAAGVDEANLACWGIECANPTLDGLLGYNGSSRRANWWTYADYGAMSGVQLPVTSTDDTVSTVATLDSGTVQALVGRAASCITTSPLAACSWPALATVEPIQVNVKVPWPAGSASVSVTPIPATTSLLPAPAATTSSVDVVDGTVTVTLPAGAGEAFDLSVTPEP